MASDLRGKLFGSEQVSKESLVLMVLSHNGAFLADHKYFLSIERGYAVGVPEAVDDILERCPYDGMRNDKEFLEGRLRVRISEGFLLEGEKEPLIFNVKARGGISAQKVWEPDEVWHNRLRMSSHSFVSEERVSRLEGELRRFGAQMSHSDPREVAVTPSLIKTYCQWYNVLPLYDKMTAASGFH